MCSAVVGLSFSYGAGLCGFVRWTRVPFKLCCFQSLPRGGHQHKTRDRFCFGFFSFFLFCLLLVGHKASRSKVSSDCMLDLFGFFLFLSWRYVILMCVCLSDWRKKCEGSDYFVMFSVKLGNLMTHLPKHPRLNIWYDPSFCLFAWRKLFPKLQWLWFSWLPAMYRCMCYVIETTFSICAWYILLGWPDPQRGFFS